MTVTKHVVDAPVSVPYPHGLFAAVTPRPAVDPHWRNGVTWQSQSCGLVKATINPCLADEVDPLTPDDLCSVLDYDPFTLYAFNDDSVPGRTLEQHRQDTIDRLVAGEQFTAEQHLWGLLTTAVPVPVDLTAYPGWLALGHVEQALAEAYGGLGIIHMSRLAATALALHLRFSQGTVTTMLGTPVVIGGGYDPLVSPFSPTATIMGTGPLVMYRGEIDTDAFTIERPVNNLSYVAQRDYVIGWDCAAVGAVAYIGTPPLPPEE